MKNINEKSKYLNVNKKAYYGSVALMALMCASSISHAMEFEDTRESSQPLSSRKIENKPSKNISSSIDTRPDMEAIEEQNEISLLRKAIDEVTNMIPAERDKGIALLGMSGAGKSTLFNYLFDVPLVGKKITESFGSFVIETGECSLSKIITGYNSGTTLPVIEGDYYDFAGFRAASGTDGKTAPVQDIVNAYSIYKLLNNTKNLKILLVASEDQLKGKTEFLPAIEQLQEMFQSNDITQGLCMVITGREQITSLKKFKKALTKRCGKVEHLTNSQRELTNFLSSEQNNQIAFFDKPKNKGPISDTNKQEINTAIKNTRYLTDLQPKISILKESEYLIKEWVVHLFAEVSDIIAGDFKNSVVHYCNERIHNHSGSAKKLRESFEKILEEIDTILNNGVKFEGTLTKILSFTKKYLKEDALFNKLSKKLEELNFIRSVTQKETAQNDNTRWYNEISTLKDNINDLTKDPTYDGEGALQGFIVGLDDIKIEKPEVNIFSLNSFIMDKDIILPGINLSILAPYWKVVGEGKKTINLKGKDGEEQKKKNAKSAQSNNPTDIGKNGKPGNPGENGGHFYGEGQEFSNLDSLIINVSGSNGGLGQNGGNGVDGDSEKPYLTSVQPLQDHCSNKQYKMIYKTGSPGGKGGLGGKPGLSGSIDVNFHQSIVEVKEDGKIGVEGASGIHGTQYQGVYVKEETTSWSEEIGDGIKVGIAIGAGGGTVITAIRTLGDLSIAVATGPIAMPFIIGKALATETIMTIIGGAASLPFSTAKKVVQSISVYANSDWVEPMKEIPCKDENELYSDEIKSPKSNDPIDKDLKKEAYKAYYEKHSHNVFAMPLDRLLLPPPLTGPVHTEPTLPIEAQNVQSQPPIRLLPPVPTVEKNEDFPPPPTDIVNAEFPLSTEPVSPDLLPPPISLCPVLPVNKEKPVLPNTGSQAENPLPFSRLNVISVNALQEQQQRLNPVQDQPKQEPEPIPCPMMMSKFSGRGEFFRREPEPNPVSVLVHSPAFLNYMEWRRDQIAPSENPDDEFSNSSHHNDNDDSQGDDSGKLK